MKNTNRIEPPTFGASSLLLIFASLCLTVFVLLTLSTVQADRKLSVVSANIVSDYYKADLEAEEIFSMLRAGIVPETVRVDQNRYYYSCYVSPTQSIAVELSYENGIWSVLRWQSVTSNS